MKEKCLNCGKEINVLTLKHDENNLEGFYAECPECGASFDLSFDVSQTFIMDGAKMADFKTLSKEEFLRSYGYLTEDEYDSTKLYYNWLCQ